MNIFSFFSLFRTALDGNNAIKNSKLNYKGGFFRIWVALSLVYLLFAIPISLLGNPDIYTPLFWIIPPIILFVFGIIAGIIFKVLGLVFAWIKEGFKPSLIDALSEAIKAGSVEKLEQVLIEYKVNEKKLNKLFCISYAIINNAKLEIIEALIEAGADVNKKNEYGYSPLDTAVINGFDDEIIDTLVEAGATSTNNNFKLINNPKPKTIQKLIDNGVKFKKDILHQAIDRNASLETIKILIDAGADVNAKDSYFGIALLERLISKSSDYFIQVLQLLIASGADVNARDKDGEHLLITSMKRKFSKEIIMALVAGGADVNAKFNKKETVYYPCDSDCGISNNTTPLMFAIGYYDSYGKEVVKAIINAGADVNAKDIWEMTPLMRACCREETTSEYDEEKDDLNYRVIAGDTEEIIKLLIDAGADITAKDKDGKTAYDYAKENEAIKDNVELLNRLKPTSS